MDIHTPRLLLRDCRIEDYASVHAFTSDPEVTRHTAWGPNTPEDTTAFLSAAIADARRRPRIRFSLAMVEIDADVLIGLIELRNICERTRRADLGYVLSPAWRGRGYASEAATALLRFGFDLGLRKIVATCDPCNTAAADVLERIGMTREGYLRDHVQVRGQWRDRLLYAALSTDARQLAESGPTAGRTRPRSPGYP
ncbi:MAG: GNAT family N-acetyltransferase [Micromonosporaceae bacterium]|nr:GNAT family N-acetyltransferase [Micromonosporaceae bacterium]